MMTLAIMLAATGPERFIPKQEVLADFAKCAVKRESGWVRALLATTPGTPEESLAFRSLGRLESCLTTCEYLSARAGEIRGALAEAAWPIQGLIRHFRPELERRIRANRGDTMMEAAE